MLQEAVRLEVLPKSTQLPSIDPFTSRIMALIFRASGAHDWCRLGRKSELQSRPSYTSVHIEFSHRYITNWVIM
jgi:hypothetical protein